MECCRKSVLVFFNTPALHYSQSLNSRNIVTLGKLRPLPVLRAVVPARLIHQLPDRELHQP